MKHIDLYYHEAAALNSGRLGVIIRAVKWQKTPKWHDWDSDPNIILNGAPMCCWSDGCGKEREFKIESPFGQPGTVIGCREEWYLWDSMTDQWEGDMHEGPLPKPKSPEEIAFWKTRVQCASTHPMDDTKTRRASTMPDWAIRHRVIVGEVRCVRVQDVTEEEAKAMSPRWAAGDGCSWGWTFLDGNGYVWETATGAFGELFNSLHGPGSWEVNPWVWVATIKPE